MNSQTRRLLESYKQSVNFCDAPPPPLNTPTAQLGSDFLDRTTQLQTAVDRMIAAATELHSGGQRAAIRNRQAQRAVLWKELFLVHRVARALQLTNTGIPQLAPMPAETGSRETLLATARAVVRDVTPYWDLFVRYGLLQTTLTHLQDLILTVEEHSEEIRTGRKARAAAREELKLALNDAKVARAQLDVIIDLACKHDPAKGPAAWNAWLAMRHVERAPKRAGTTESEPATPTLVPASTSKAPTTQTTQTTSTTPEVKQAA